MEENEKNVEVVKTSDWLVTYLITAIPLVGIIMLFVWAFGGSTNPNKANWAKAALLLALIAIGFYIAIIMIFGAAFLTAMS